MNEKEPTPFLDELKKAGKDIEKMDILEIAKHRAVYDARIRKGG